MLTEVIKTSCWGSAHLLTKLDPHPGEMQRGISKRKSFSFPAHCGAKGGFASILAFNSFKPLQSINSTQPSCWMMVPNKKKSLALVTPNTPGPTQRQQLAKRESICAMSPRVKSNLPNVRWGNRNTQHPGSRPRWRSSFTRGVFLPSFPAPQKIESQKFVLASIRISPSRQDPLMGGQDQPNPGGGHSPGGWKRCLASIFKFWQAEHWNASPRPKAPEKRP